MKNEQCPICYHELEVRDCAPCDDCGHQEIEIQHFNEGIHDYKIFQINESLRLQLCDFCNVDFGSYLPSYFGFKSKHEIKDPVFVSDIANPCIEKDKYCPECRLRLKFLNFIEKIRAQNKDL